MDDMICGWCGQMASSHTKDDWSSHQRAAEQGDDLIQKNALRQIANLDATELRAKGYSVGDMAISIAKRALNEK